MTPVATANIHEVVSASLCTWITESLEQFGVDSRVFLRVIQSVLEQDIQSLRGEERLNDLWSYRLESIGSKRKPMSKEDLLRRVLLEHMRPCFKEVRKFSVACCSLFPQCQVFSAENRESVEWWLYWRVCPFAIWNISLAIRCQFPRNWCFSCGTFLRPFKENLLVSVLWTAMVFSWTMCSR